MSISNVMYKLGTFGVLTDGYISRIPQSAFFGGGGGLAQTRQAYVSDVAAVKRVLMAIGGPSRIALLLNGHSHFDHSFDTATWSKLTNAPIIGPKTTCLQAQAAGLPQNRCRAVFGGERIDITDGVWMRVIRWNHSGDSAHILSSIIPSSSTRCRRSIRAPAVCTRASPKGFPTGVAIARNCLWPTAPVDAFAWFFQNSVSLSDISTPIVVGGVDYGAPIENLKAAVKAEGLSSVDLWIGTADAGVARLLLPILAPKAYLPVHWDGLYGAFEAGVPTPYADAGLETSLAEAKVPLLRPVQYMRQVAAESRRRAADPQRRGQESAGVLT